MMADDGLRGWRARLRDVLNTVWNPIGDCPPDEYDTYNVAITNMLGSGAEVSDDDLHHYLLRAERDVIGLTNGDQPAAVARRQRAVQAIRALGSPGLD